MDELIAFLRARLDEDQTAAAAASPVTSEEPGDYSPYRWWYDFDATWVTEADMKHIARHDPGRVLREVEAKRRILALYEQAENEPVGKYGEPDDAVAHRLALEHAVRLLAEPYADHDDYRPEWRP